jgi:hypothetical protein
LISKKQRNKGQNFITAFCFYIIKKRKEDKIQKREKEKIQRENGRKKERNDLKRKEISQ